MSSGGGRRRKFSHGWKKMEEDKSGRLADAVSRD
jgi:hypothetical protein